MYDQPNLDFDGKSMALSGHLSHAPWSCQRDQRIPLGPPRSVGVSVGII